MTDATQARTIPTNVVLFRPNLYKNLTLNPTISNNFHQKVRISISLIKEYLSMVQIVIIVAGISAELMIKKLRYILPPSRTEAKDTP